MQKIFENKFTEIYDISTEIPETIYAIWRNYMTLENTEAVLACEKSLEYIKSANIKVMISDHQYLEGATIPFLEWIQKYYFPKALENGLIAEIILISDHILGNISLELMYNVNDLIKYQNDKQLYTPRIDNLQNAKIVARQIVEKSKLFV